LIISLGAINPNLALLSLANLAPAQWELRSAKNLRCAKEGDVLNFPMLLVALDEVLSGKTKPVKPEVVTSSFGATPLRSLMKKEIDDRLANLLLADEVVDGSFVKVDVTQDQDKLEVKVE
jgi:hypothetical protein